MYGNMLSIHLSSLVVWTRSFLKGPQPRALYRNAMPCAILWHAKFLHWQAGTYWPNEAR